MGRVAVLFLCSLLAVVWSCQPPDCDHPDCGSCGHACCLMEFKFFLSPEDTYSTLVKSLKAGGADGRYSFVNGSDLRPYKLKSGAQFILQGVHTTLKMHYNDTLDLLIASNSTTESFVRSFSISRIWDALCDDGQNYKNLVGFVKGLGMDFGQRVLLGCQKTYGNKTTFNSQPVASQQ